MVKKSLHTRINKAIHAIEARPAMQEHFWYDRPRYHDEPITWHCWCSATLAMSSLDTLSIDEFLAWINEHAPCPSPDVKVGEP